MKIASIETAQPNSNATTAEVAKEARLAIETLLRMKRMKNGPFAEHRDWVFIGAGTRQLRWNKEQAIKSLWNYKRQPASEVETFSASASPLS